MKSPTILHSSSHIPPPSITPSDVANDDLLLLAQINERNMNALESLYDQYSRAIFLLINRIVKEEGVAEGLVQETFMIVWRKSHTFSGSGVPAAWMFRIARNLALDYLRRKRVRPAIIEKELEAHYDLTNDSSTQALTRTEAQVEQGYHHRLIQSALAEIPAEQRNCLHLAYFEGMSQREIAIHTNTPLGTIKTRIRMGMEKLERLLKSYGYSTETV